MSYYALRRMLFMLPPEMSHDLVLAGLAAASRSEKTCQLLSRFNRAKQFELPLEVMGLKFSNPVGLAAGLDKQANALPALHALGFGWLELGTVTPLPQSGNPKPRMFRVTTQNALVNRLGFNSVGLERFLKNLRRCRQNCPHTPIISGINIGKNRATALHEALHDYRTALQAVYQHADYVAINISSPNTPGLRDLHDKSALAHLLSGLHRTRNQLAEKHGRRLPLVLKIAPGLEHKTLDHIAALARQHQMDGLAATNSMLLRTALPSLPAGISGGLSGPPLADLATDTIAYLSRNLQGEIPIIGIGGIDSPSQALEKFQAGADLIQLYSGFIYHGPKLIRDIIQAITHDKKHQSLQGWLDSLRSRQATTNP